MLKTVIISENSLVADDAETFQVENVLDFLIERWGQFPDNCRIYHNELAQQNDVTPIATEDSTTRFLQLEGTFYIVVYPKFFFIGLFSAFNGLFGILLLGLISYLLRPKPPKAKNTQENSPNNGLSDRKNEARPLARIPDIFGKIRSTPDLIAKPYLLFENHREVEYAYLCVGRGEYLIEDVKDDVTPVNDIAGISVEVFGPSTSPHTGSIPQLRIGPAIDERILNVSKSNSVNGQVLRAPNASTVKGDDDLAFIYPDQIVTAAEVNFEEFYAPDDLLTISNSTYNGPGGVTVNLDGVYVVLAVTSNTITLVNPANVNSDWNLLQDLPDDQTDFYSPTLTSSTDKWVGPFIVDEPYSIWNNFVAQNGLYKDDGKKQTQFDVEIEVQYTPVDKFGNQIGDMQDGECTIIGSSVLKNSRAITHKYTVVPTAEDAVGVYWKVRARRVTPADLDFEGRIIDEVQWRDLYAAKYVTKTHFGNVTTIHAKTYATSGALSIKERKLNCHATRKIPDLLPNTTYDFTSELYPTEDAALIFIAVCVDPYIGRRTYDEIDLKNIFQITDQIKDYFGTNQAAIFNHTFDESNLSFEETISLIAEAIFCKAYRLGNQLRLNFDKKTRASRLLFNHRNKIPRSEQRSIAFGNYQDNDGVDFEYIDQLDGATLNFLIPTDGSATNPKKITSVGIQNEVQAHFHAWRAYQRLLHQRVVTEFEATAEANVLVLNDKIVVADNTRPETIDGEILKQDGLTLTLSQPFVPEVGIDYTIFLQHYNGTVQFLDVDSVPNDYQIVLGGVPNFPLVTSKDSYARTVYSIVKEDNYREHWFLVQEKDPQSDKQTIKLTAVNYDDRYYSKDRDFINGEFEDQRILFQATFEEITCPRGTFVAVNNPSGFTSSGTIEVQNNISFIGPAAEGEKHIELDGTRTIHKDLTTNTAKTYRLLLNYSGRPGVDGPNNAISIYWDSVYLRTLQTDGVEFEETQWEFFDLALPNPTTTTTRIEFRSVQDGGLGMGGLLDNIRVMEYD